MFLEQDGPERDLSDDVSHDIVAIRTHTPREIGRYGERRGANWPILAGILIFHAILLGAIISHRIAEHRKAPQSLAIFDIELQEPAPPPPPPKEKPTPVKVVTPLIVAPTPIVTLPTPPVQIAVTNSPPPPQPAAVQRAATPPAPTGPVGVGALSSNMISATPPRYPVESRRKREQGTVVMTVILDTEGRVSDISLKKGSGFQRLDDAALSAVRRWRWSPIMRNGSAVMVRGVVEIPFILQG